MTATAGYSHKAEAERAIKIKIERAITMCQGDNPNPDMAIKHPEWIRAAQNKDYTELTKKITMDCKKYQSQARERRNRLGGKN